MHGSDDDLSGEVGSCAVNQTRASLSFHGNGALTGTDKP